MDGRAVGLVAALLATLGLLTARAGRAADPPPRPDAQMLLDLELLREADLARDRSVLTRLRLLERMRLLESLPVLESQTQPAPPAPAKEVK
jgi:hypothetical protein